MSHESSRLIVSSQNNPWPTRLMKMVQTISPCLWCNGNAEELAKYYTTIFKRSKITAISRFTEAGKEIHGRKPGSVMTVAFEIAGQEFTALNGGPLFKFNEAISLQVFCDTQKEINHYWNKLSRGGPKNAQQCGWLKDKFGVSWQIVPRILPDLLLSKNREKSTRAMGAMMKMKKLDIAKLRAAFDGR